MLCNFYYLISGGLRLETVVPKQDTDSYQHTLEFLYPYHNYTVYLVAYSSLYNSQKSQPITFMTKEDCK